MCFVPTDHVPADDLLSEQSNRHAQVCPAHGALVQLLSASPAHEVAVVALAYGKAQGHLEAHWTLEQFPRKNNWPVFKKKISSLRLSR
jgi:hypothetical protein